MRLKLKTGPTVEPISLEEAKNHLKVDGGEDNALITALIKTARELAERDTKRAFITQIWQMFLDEAPAEIEIPKPPLQNVESIKVIDVNDAETVIDPLTYYVDKAENSPGRVNLKSGCYWPMHRNFSSFIIEFKCGYGVAGMDVPEALRQGLLQLIAFLYENRGAEEIPKGIKALFWPFKILRF